MSKQALFIVCLCLFSTPLWAQANWGLPSEKKEFNKSKDSSAYSPRTSSWAPPRKKKKSKTVSKPSWGRKRSYYLDQEINLDLEYKNYNPGKEYGTILNFIQSRYINISDDDADLIASYLVDYGKKHNIDPKFVAAVIARESSFNKKAVSRTGAKGLGQIKDFNFKALEINDPFNIGQNVEGTIKYLKELQTNWKGNSNSARLALASYYKGPTAIRNAKGKYDGDTKNYVEDIITYYKEIVELHKKRP